MRRAAAAGALVLAAVLLTGCTTQAPTVSSGEGAVTEYQHSTLPAVSFSGPLLGGGRFSSADHAGDVLVVNFWYAACGPCQAEAPNLDTIAKRFAGQKVQFVGVDVRDDAGTAKPFVEQYEVTYPVILDQQDGNAVQLAFAKSAPPTTTPTTLVVGTGGRVTASIIGQIDPDILTTLVQSALSGRDS